jgi:putative NIF3 family GTP cyclohydrolase 1 type 2
MLDPRPAHLRKALDNGADLVLAHHPLTMRPCFLDQLDDYHRSATLLLSSGVCLYSAHTSLDVNLNGPAAWLANALGLRRRSALEALPPPAPQSPVPFGFGLAGDLPEPLPYEDFIQRLGLILEKREWTAAGPRPDMVARVAYCPGSGGDLVPAAEASGADVYITGDLKYHTALEATLRVLDVGHFVLEDAMMRFFADQLRNDLPLITVLHYPARDPLAFEKAGVS